MNSEGLSMKRFICCIPESGATYYMERISFLGEMAEPRVSYLKGDVEPNHASY